MSKHRHVDWLAAFVAAAAITGIASCAVAGDDENSDDLSARIGAERTVGKYGTRQATTIWTFPFDLLYSQAHGVSALKAAIDDPLRSDVR